MYALLGVTPKRNSRLFGATVRSVRGSLPAGLGAPVVCQGSRPGQLRAEPAPSPPCARSSPVILQNTKLIFRFPLAVCGSGSRLCPAVGVWGPAGPRRGSVSAQASLRGPGCPGCAPPPCLSGSAQGPPCPPATPDSSSAACPGSPKPVQPFKRLLTISINLSKMDYPLPRRLPARPGSDQKGIALAGGRGRAISSVMQS